MDSESKSAALYRNLDTSFVNLWSLLRYLSQRAFVGRVRVDLKDYTADVFLTGSNTPLVHEVDRAAGTDILEEAALHRLVLRARESPGSISVFEGADEAVAAESAKLDSKSAAARSTASVHESRERSLTPVIAAPLSAGATSSGHDYSADASASSEKWGEAQSEPASEADWNDLLQASGELIGCVERALVGVGADFASLFRAARLDLADDYTFLDPVSGRLYYATSVVNSADQIPADIYVAGVSQALRRVIDEVAIGDRARRVRERVALELAKVARKRNAALARSGFQPQLDRIAGTKVL